MAEEAKEAFDHDEAEIERDRKGEDEPKLAAQMMRVAMVVVMPIIVVVRVVVMVMMAVTMIAVIVAVPGMTGIAMIVTGPVMRISHCLILHAPLPASKGAHERGLEALAQKRERRPTL
jgi:uncharacterized membrane protein